MTAPIRLISEVADYNCRFLVFLDEFEIFVETQ